MSVAHVKYLLVGAGLASSAAVEAIRALDPAGSVLMVGQEISAPYHRPPLSKQYLRRQGTRGELSVLPAQWFEQHRVTLRTGRRVAQLDAARMSLTLDSGEEISFDRLLLATGAAPARLVIPGAQLPNVFYLRTLEDVDRLHKAIDKAKVEGRPHAGGRGRAAVIGGGTLGVEVGASLRQVGLDVTMLLAAAHPWEKFAGESTGAVVSRYLEARGVHVMSRSAPQRIEGDGRVQRVIAGGAAIEADFVVAAVGITVPRDLLRGTNIAAEVAILTDSRCQTNVPGIFAAGDCAALFDPLFNKHRVLDHWEHARTSGTLAGRNMAGADETYGGVNHFSSEVFDLALSAWGEPKLVERRLIRGSPNADAPDFVEIGIAADGRIAQVLSIGHGSENDLLERLVAKRVRVNGNEEQFKDPGTPLGSLVGE